MKKISVCLAVLGCIALLTACGATPALPPAKDSSSQESSSSSSASHSQEASHSTLPGMKEQPATDPIIFPAYQKENPNNTEHIKALNALARFEVTVDLPKNWTLRTATKGKANFPTGDFATPFYFYDGDTLLGYIGFNIFNPEDFAHLSDDEYYKSVYAFFRTYSHFTWDPYTPITTTETTQVAIADVWYVEPSEFLNYTGRLDEAPSHETIGILYYDKTLGVYVGIAFMPGTMDKEKATEIAKSIGLSLV